jgi:CYTH domain-containing protein
MSEVERKFIVTDWEQQPLGPGQKQERYYLYVEGGYELRVQRRGNHHSLERKHDSNFYSADTQSINLTPAEFARLKELAEPGLARTSYQLPDQADATVNVYHGRFEGLARAEFEFADEAAAKAFQAPAWAGAEITTTELGRDKKLGRLTRERFEALLAEYSR